MIPTKSEHVSSLPILPPLVSGVLAATLSNGECTALFLYLSSAGSLGKRLGEIWFSPQRLEETVNVPSPAWFIRSFFFQFTNHLNEHSVDHDWSKEKRPDSSGAIF